MRVNELVRSINGGQPPEQSELAGLSLVDHARGILSGRNLDHIPEEEEWSILAVYVGSRRERSKGNPKPLSKFGQTWDGLPEETRSRLKPCIEAIRDQISTPGFDPATVQGALIVHGEVSRDDGIGWNS